MHQLVVLYPQPDSPEAFLEYYKSKHLKLVERLPGLLTYRYGVVQPLGPDSLGNFLVFEAVFASQGALLAALDSDVGKAIVADVPNYSPKGHALLHFNVMTPHSER